MSEEEKSINTKNLSLIPFTIVSIGYGIFLIVITFFQWDLIEQLTPFFLPFLILVLWMVLAIITLAAIIYIPFQFKKILWKSIIPLIVNIIIILILYFVPFTGLWLNIEFQTNKSGYEHVIKMYEEGDLQPNERGMINLPEEYQHLSKGEEILSWIIVMELPVYSFIPTEEF